MEHATSEEDATSNQRLTLQKSWYLGYPLFEHLFGNSVSTVKPWTSFRNGKFPATIASLRPHEISLAHRE